jgi:hypothetical protein
MGLRAVVVVVLLGGGVAGADAPKRPAPVARAATKKPAVPATTALMVDYQRVGRDIMQLQNLRGSDCTAELYRLFRTIKIDDAVATPEARVAMAATLQELQSKLQRQKGVTVSQECLDNPLAPGCL